MGLVGHHVQLLHVVLEQPESQTVNVLLLVMVAVQHGTISLAVGVPVQLLIVLLVQLVFLPVNVVTKDTHLEVQSGIIVQKSGAHVELLPVALVQVVLRFVHVQQLETGQHLIISLEVGVLVQVYLVLLGLVDHLVNVI